MIQIRVIQDDNGKWYVQKLYSQGCVFVQNREMRWGLCSLGYAERGMAEARARELCSGGRYTYIGIQAKGE